MHFVLAEGKTKDTKTPEKATTEGKPCQHHKGGNPVSVDVHGFQMTGRTCLERSLPSISDNEHFIYGLISVSEERESATY